jgi:hypothetical protein
MIDTDATYNESFSTVVRAARGAKLSGPVREEDLDGKYPLPNYLKATRVWLPGFGKIIKSRPSVRRRGFTSLEIPLDEIFPSNRAAMDSRLLEPYRSGRNSSIDHTDSPQFKRSAPPSYTDGLTDHI